MRAEIISYNGDSEQPSSSSQADGETLETPRKVLSRAIIQAIVPPLSEENRLSHENSKRTQKQVQAKHGEVLTSAEAVERLRREEFDRQKKETRAANSKKKAVRKLNLSDSDPEEDAQCVACSRWWSSYKGNDDEEWVMCDQCDGYTCPRCTPWDIDLDAHYTCEDGSEAS